MRTAHRGEKVDLEDAIAPGNDDGPDWLGKIDSYLIRENVRLAEQGHHIPRQLGHEFLVEKVANSLGDRVHRPSPATITARSNCSVITTGMGDRAPELGETASLNDSELFTAPRGENDSTVLEGAVGALRP